MKIRRKHFLQYVRLTVDSRQPPEAPILSTNALCPLCAKSGSGFVQQRSDILSQKDERESPPRRVNIA
jgi:hypothetical protein